MKDASTLTQARARSVDLANVLKFGSYRGRQMILEVGRVGVWVSRHFANGHFTNGHFAKMSKMGISPTFFLLLLNKVPGI